MNTSPKNRTALMVFSLSAAREAERKQVFGRNRERATTDFFQLLIDDTQLLARQSGLDVIWMGENQQRGRDFASRFSNAFQDLFDRGYEQVISIGNDCPHLKKGHLQRSVKQLENNDWVLGPAEDGGVYLLGITKKAFDREGFQRLPWQQKELYAAIEKLFSASQIESFSFAPLDDLDDFTDVLRFYRNNPTGVLGNFIASILHGVSGKFPPQRPSEFLQTLLRNLPSRAPPYSVCRDAA